MLARCAALTACCRHRRHQTIATFALLVALPGKCLAAGLPDYEELLNLRKCRDEGQFADFTEFTPGLPQCLSACPPGTDQLQEPMLPGDTLACVWPASQARIILQFELHDTCRASECKWRGQWQTYRQLVSLKVAQAFGIALSELQSALLFWAVPQLPVSEDSPKLNKFLISRKGEADWPGRRLQDVNDDPVFLLHLAFRVDSRRIHMGGGSRLGKGLDLIYSNDTTKLYDHLGIRATVHNINPPAPRYSSSQRSVGEKSEFEPVFQFTTPGHDLNFGGIARSEQEHKCIHKCYVWNEMPQRGKCQSDCDCNSERWCSHLGECTGEGRRCLGPDYVKTTVTSTSTLLRTTTRTPSPTRTITTTESPLQRIRDSDCRHAIHSIWYQCHAGLKTRDACQGPACGILDEVVFSHGLRKYCKKDICDGKFVFWQQQCGDADENQTFTSERMVLCGLQAPTTTKRSSGAINTDEGNEVSVLILVLAFVGVAVLHCVVCLAKSLRDYGYDHPICHCFKWCCSKCTNQVRTLCPRRQQRPPTKPKLERKATVGPRRASQEEDQSRPPNPWGSAFLHSISGLGKTVPAEAPTPQDTKPAKKKKNGPQRSNSTTTTDSARQAWSESRANTQASDAWSPSSGLQTPATAPPLVAKSPASATETMVAELRSLRTFEHSADERKKFYRQQTLKWHPDKNIGNEEQAADLFKVLQENKGWFLNEDP